ncbi:alcohol dehydrogenase, propanol-preferring [Xaviernesmea oryzae]|uniref:alcohol dehydrogenase n=1 Tax=Xaviernesmea oryzae TaxID=464029 RepID=A0A1X7DJY8_9HYPH|nr:alcohol dehydrogenase [Xaviernesmea oryzae]SMF16949.1 alcohol dehydrogenase, propanol-preferring [Xaviernesmea oryzae]
MRSWKVFEASEVLRQVKEATPEPAGSEVVVSVSHCGLCHSDITLWKGVFDMGDKKVTIDSIGMKHPITLGHEILGTVSAVGPDVTDVKIGDRRLVYPWLGCGECDTCRTGRENLCMQGRPLGMRRPGGFGSHVVVPHSRYLIDTGDLDPALAATYACSGLTAYSAIRKAMPASPDEAIVVVGAGGLGLSGIVILKAFGHENIVVVDVSEDKLETAVKAGAHKTVLSTGDDVTKKIVETAGRPVRTIIDFVNNSQTAAFSFPALARGGRIIMVGMFGGQITVPTMRMAQGGLSLIGSITGTLQELRDLVELAKRGKLDAIPYEAVPKTSINDAMDRLRRGAVKGRIVLQEEIA